MTNVRYISVFAAVPAVVLLGVIFSSPSGKAQSDKGLTAQLSMRSSPHDTTPYVRAAGAEDRTAGLVGAAEGSGWTKELSITPEGAAPSVSGSSDRSERIGRLHIRDTVVSNTDPDLKTTDTFNDGETSIAINGRNRREIVITAFSGAWGENAPIWHSTDGGNTWTKQFTVPVPPGVPSAFGCPCDQTIDYGRRMRLSGVFLATDLYSGTTDTPSDAARWNWFVVNGITQTTNLFGLGNADQPWLLVNRDPEFEDQDNIYVAYDDFSGAPDMRVSVSPSQVSSSTMPPRFIRDELTGFSTGFVNPGHRLAKDPRKGYLYSLFQRRIDAGADGSQNINYMLNRSTDGGQTWTLNGSSTGIVIANADSTQPTPKFGTVNALLGGVLHAAVDPKHGDIYYVYGNRDSVSGSNRLAIRRIHPLDYDDDDDHGSKHDHHNRVIVGPERFVTDQVGLVQAAIPSVAVTSNGTVGVFYYTFDGFSSSGFPIFSAHLSISTDRGITFGDRVLETFLSVAKDDGNPRQRVLGDYMQMKAVKDTFYGAFTGDGVPFGRTFSNHDPIFFKVRVSSDKDDKDDKYDKD